MEWWILSGVVVAGAAGILFVRLRRGRRGHAAPETKNVYPLW
jgi:hypothetical protein